MLRALLAQEPCPPDARYCALPPDLELAPGPRRGGSRCGSGAGARRPGCARVARAGDGWLASAYNTTPEQFAAARAALAGGSPSAAGSAEGFPSALATMWTWVTEDAAERDRVLADVLAPVVRRDPDELRAQVCIGSAEHCAELLSRYARGRLRARLPVAAGRRAPPARARGQRGGAAG